MISSILRYIIVVGCVAAVVLGFQAPSIRRTGSQNCARYAQRQIYRTSARGHERKREQSNSSIKKGSIEDEISPYYRRDKWDLNAKLPDRDRMASLLKERYERRVRKLSVSNIDRKLREEFGVRVFDSPPIWTRRRSTAALRRRQKERLENRLVERFGPTKHPLFQVGEGSSSRAQLSLPEINRLLCAREESRLHGQRSKEKAEAIVFELWVHGIDINDAENQWTFDETCSLPVERHDEILEENDPDTAAAFSVPDGDSRQRVLQLLEKYDEATAIGDAWTATFLCFELFMAYEQQASVRHNGDTAFCLESVCNQCDELLQIREVFPPVIYLSECKEFESEQDAYRLSSSSDAFPGGLSVQTRVEQLVCDRMHKREEGKFLEADALRKELWEAYNVGINDRLRQYSVGGAFDDASDTVNPTETSE